MKMQTSLLRHNASCFSCLIFYLLLVCLLIFNPAHKQKTHSCLSNTRIFYHAHMSIQFFGSYDLAVFWYCGLLTDCLLLCKVLAVEFKEYSHFLIATTA